MTLKKSKESIKTNPHPNGHHENGYSPKRLAKALVALANRVEGVEGGKVANRGAGVDKLDNHVVCPGRRWGVMGAAREGKKTTGKARQSGEDEGTEIIHCGVQTTQSLSYRGRSGTGKTR